ncbi:MAG: sigma-54-dependent Fis family transcriptional regulator [Burkholderiales bacterium]|nr:sigma-54-dependent Fis family transcriptional regulator [Burkholderiales bacterium]
MPHALIVEDDPNSADMLAELVAAEGFSTATAGSLHDARQQIAFRQPDVVLLDLSLPDGSGMELFESVDRGESCEIVLITGHASLETSIQALRLGAADYLLKPVNVARLRNVLGRANRSAETRGRLNDERGQAEAKGRFGRLWGRSPVMLEIYRQIGRVAPTAVTALITGESGTGKEVVAQTIHELSKRSRAPFLAVNCGAISPQLIESELFGHEKGSFTGALRQHRGFFERADGGTLFLDEITEMPLELQVKLLRVLETGTFTRVGSDEPVTTDVRIVAATNRVPAEAVSSGRLREDLYYRLNVFPIHLPALRERLEDIDLLAEHFLAGLNEREGANKRLSDDAIAALKSYHWPGNVRELRNAIHRGFILAEKDVIDADSLPFDHAPAPDPAPAMALGGVPADSAGALAAQPPGGSPLGSAAALAGHPAMPAGSASAAAIALPADPLAAGHAGLGRPLSAPGTSPNAAADRINSSTLEIAVGMSIAEAERRLILATLAHCGGHRERASEMLGVSPKTLYNRLKTYERETGAE